MYLRDLVVHADHAIFKRFEPGFVGRFDREASSVADHYLSLIQRQVVTASTGKISLTFSDPVDDPLKYWPGRELFPWPFDFAAYVATLDNAVKQRMILEALHDGLMWIGSSADWVTGPFENAYRTILDREFRFTGYSKKTWLNPARKFRARTYFDWRLDGIELFAVLYRNRSKIELGQISLGITLPMAGVLHEYLTTGRWDSDSTFVVEVSLPFRKTWSADFSALMDSP